ncbi:hypothetical protein PM023_13185 [Halorubrum ezzemoulense]|uniref:hypothetical protein n=1 Tax=Halorubrum ezzemoulense TaxID=337243 RepID=UPI00232C5DA2|nr:hypothetical protein [Halorubrum ezzemoulense]MDB2225624.1 hypothetical protein [Halorubrum ezzemoulense]
MTDTSWTIQTLDNGTLTVPGAVGKSMPTFGVGRTISLQFLADSDGVTFDTLREYARYSNDSTTSTGTDIRGKPWYHQSIHPSAGFASALVLLKPGTSVGDLRDWWAVVTDASITTTTVGTGRRITLECFILAETGEYSERQFVVDEFEAGL